jgi:hypothetical protein
MLMHAAARSVQPRRHPLWPPCVQGFNTECTEDLSDLSVEALPITEDTEALRTD